MFRRKWLIIGETPGRSRREIIRRCWTESGARSRAEFLNGWAYALGSPNRARVEKQI